MVENRKIIHFLILTIFIVFSNCEANLYPVKNKIDKLSICLDFDDKIKEEDKIFLKRKLLHFIEDYNSTPHTFIVDTGLTDEGIILHLKKIKYSSALEKVGSVLFNFGYGLWLTNGNGILYLPLLTPYNRTKFEYSLGKSLKAGNEKRINLSFVSNGTFFRKRDKERIFHLSNFNFQLFLFLEEIEKQYRKTNGLPKIKH
jgi:hypothetical protein